MEIFGHNFLFWGDIPGTSHIGGDYIPGVPGAVDAYEHEV